MKRSLKYNISQRIRLIESYINKKIINSFNYKGLIIIGCGRSGTTYTAKLFRKNGYKIGHERLKVNGIASWYLVSDQQKELFGPSLHSIKKTDFPIVHQVRNPIDAIPRFKVLVNQVGNLFIMKRIFK